MKNKITNQYYDYPKNGSHRWWENKKRVSNKSQRGRPSKFNTPNELWKASTEYFQWVDSHPIKVTKSFVHNGQINTYEISHQRPYTLTGLCLYLNITLEGWSYYKKYKEDFLGVCSMVEDIIYCNKFEGAAIGIFNQRIIARDLGLRN